jgi:Ser/Thr protein kinase RdoA (MazF antagonist)
MIPEILQKFNLLTPATTFKSFGSGLINNTWFVADAKNQYILQRINQNVFNHPKAIDNNIKAVSKYLEEHYPSYLFTVPVSSAENQTMLYVKDQGYFRLYHFVEGSYSYDVVQQPKMAYEAAKQFGKFTRLLSGFDAETLQITLQDFHNLTLRYNQFEAAVKNASDERLAIAKQLIEDLKDNIDIVTEFKKINENPAFKKRVTHHDTKISNVLFDESVKGICVIDLDTVMPGYFISDAGDMMRTYLCAASEEETDLSKIDVREEFFEAIVQGYLGEMLPELSSQEIGAFVYSGKYMIYMQALRFLTDYLNNDVYYGAKYTLHNLTRAANQLTLLNAFIKKEPVFKEKVHRFVETAKAAI